MNEADYKQLINIVYDLKRIDFLVNWHCSKKSRLRIEHDMNYS